MDDQTENNQADPTGEATRYWLSLVRECDETIATEIETIVKAKKSELVEIFYGTMLSDPEASDFLSNKAVHGKLSMSMQSWLENLFTARTPEEVSAAVAYQRYVGEVHARINLPMHLVTRGLRLHRRKIMKSLSLTNLDRDSLLRGAEYISSLLENAIDIISGSYVKCTERVGRADESYRSFTLGHNIQVEKERQRAVLMEWAHHVLFSLHRPGPRTLPLLRMSEFGLWFNHKGKTLFDGDVEVGLIEDSITRIDETLLPRLQVSAGTGPADVSQSLAYELDAEISAIKFHLNVVFERHMEVENGRDALHGC